MQPRTSQDLRLCLKIRHPVCEQIEAPRATGPNHPLPHRFAGTPAPFRLRKKPGGPALRAILVPVQNVVEHLRPAAQAVGELRPTRERRGIFDMVLGRPNDYYLARVLAPYDGAASAQRAIALADSLFPRVTAFYSAAN